jgi:hypothetical protein
MKTVIKCLIEELTKRILTVESDLEYRKLRGESESPAIEALEKQLLSLKTLRFRFTEVKGR